MGKNRIIGKRIEEMRQANQMTREQLAERSGLSEAQVTYLEESQTVPSVAPLIKISRAFGVRLGTFLDDQEEVGAVVTPHGEIKKGICYSDHPEESRSHMIYHPLSHNKTDRHMEPFMIHIDKKAETDFPATSHEGEEFMYVTSGEIEIIYGDEVYQLKQGDSIYYDSIIPHNVYATSPEGAEVMAVIYTPF